MSIELDFTESSNGAGPSSNKYSKIIPEKEGLYRWGLILKLMQLFNDVEYLTSCLNYYVYKWKEWVDFVLILVPKIKDYLITDFDKLEIFLLWQEKIEKLFIKKNEKGVFIDARKEVNQRDLQVDMKKIEQLYLENFSIIESVLDKVAERIWKLFNYFKK